MPTILVDINGALIVRRDRRHLIALFNGTPIENFRDWHTLYQDGCSINARWDGETVQLAIERSSVEPGPIADMLPGMKQIQMDNPERAFREFEVMLGRHRIVYGRQAPLTKATIRIPTDAELHFRYENLV